MTGRLGQPIIVFCYSVDSVLHAFFHCSKTKYFIKQIETIFQNLLGKKFELNAYRMIFGSKQSGQLCVDLGNLSLE